ncbi:MAG: sensor histidine kinase [Oscillospiraceae bacterium]|nr:sensor histidine kinase [Oscillospiraceae bacterium]
MNLPKLFSLQNKFIFISVINVIIPLLLMVGLSYAKSVEMVERQLSQSNFKTVEQVGENINFVFQDMRNSSVYLLQNREFMNYLRLPKEAIDNNPGYLLSTQSLINNYLVFNTNIHSIYLDTFNGMEFDSASAQNIISEDLRQQLLQLRGAGIIVPDVITNYNGTKTRVFSYIRIIKDIENLASDLAVLKINIPESTISNVFDSRLLSENSSFLIIDENGVVISSLDEAQLGEPMPDSFISADLFQTNSGYYTVSISGEDYAVTYHNLIYPNWKLVNMAPLRELSRDILVIRNITLLSVALSVIICAIAIAYFTLKVLGPLRELRRAMVSLENEDFDVRIPVRGNDEITMLASSFNKMSNNLNELVNEVLAVQIKQKEAELKALYSQINPHFLYNTLDMIYWTCRLENAKESATLIQSLSKIFRLSLNSGNEFTSLAKEIEHLELYITIQEGRLDGNVRFSIKAAGGLMDCKVVKLILQPFVENAIIHGIEKNGGQGEIEIEIYQDGDVLVYIIRDDGVGAEEAELNSYLSKVQPDNRGFALNNVNERIQIYYGNAYGISFETAPGNGMTITVRQPIVRDSDMEA